MKRVIGWLVGVLVIASCGQDADFGGLPDSAPGEAMLLFPENNSECTEGVILSDAESEVTFRWEATVNTTSYELRVLDLAGGNLETLESNTTQLPVTLARATPYSWYVVSKNSETNQTTQSAIWSFYNAGNGSLDYIPFPAEAVSPENGAFIPASQDAVDLEWQATDLDNDIVAYDLYFGTENPPLLSQAMLTDNAFPGMAISPGTTYYWQVVSRDSAGNESTSGLFLFTVEEAP